MPYYLFWVEPVPRGSTPAKADTPQISLAQHDYLWLSFHGQGGPDPRENGTAQLIPD